MRGGGVKSNSKLKKLTFSDRIEFFDPDFVVQEPKNTISRASWVAISNIFRVIFHSGNLKKCWSQWVQWSSVILNSYCAKKLKISLNFWYFIVLGYFFLQFEVPEGRGGIWVTKVSQLEKCSFPKSFFNIEVFHSFKNFGDLLICLFVEFVKLVEEWQVGNTANF